MPRAEPKQVNVSQVMTNGADQPTDTGSTGRLPPKVGGPDTLSAGAVYFRTARYGTNPAE
jgi:hypothetical protein